MRGTLVLAVLLWATADVAAAQAPPSPAPGSVRVTVRDATGLPVSGARVILTPSTGPALTAATTDRGEALFERLTPGSYAAHVETAGFAPLERPNVAVRSGRRTDVGVVLQ